MSSFGGGVAGGGGGGGVSGGVGVSIGGGGGGTSSLWHEQQLSNCALIFLINSSISVCCVQAETSFL